MLQTELVHLCAGPSGSGKTRWLIPTLHNIWRRGRDVLGHKSYPVPWCYVCMDRPYASIQETLLTLDIDPDDIQIIPAMDLEYTSVSQVLDHADRVGAKLVVVEMFGYLMQAPQTPESVRGFMGAVSRELSGTGMTIIGTMESPKMKPRDIYKNPRQRISGPAAWGHCAETIILIEPDVKAPEDSPKRIISIHTRNGKGEIYRAEFRSDGRLYMVNEPKRKSRPASLLPSE